MTDTPALTDAEIIAATRALRDAFGYCNGGSSDSECADMTSSPAIANALMRRPQPCWPFSKCGRIRDE